MEQNTKKYLIIGGSIAGVVLLAGGITLGVVLGGSKVKNTISSNDFGIGAFSNLESFDNDGFNNGVKKGAQKYLEEYKGNSDYFTNKEKEKLELKTSKYSDDGREYVPMLTDYFSSNDIIMSAGFQVGGAITGMDDSADVTGFDGVFKKKDGTYTQYANSNEKAFILLDDQYLAKEFENTASVSFAAEGAGYLASQIAWAYTQYDASVNGKDTPNIVMWGGQPFPTVYDYMSGFAQGITDLNAEYEGGDNLNGGVFKKVELWSGGDAGEKGMALENTYGTSSDYNTWYSGGFDAGVDTESGGVAKQKTENAINAGASIVFPIAGGNTSVAESSLLNASDSTTKLIGVDSDATISSSNDELYIASAQKNLIDGGAIAIWAMDDFDNDGIRNANETEVNANDTFGNKLKDEGTFDSWIIEDSAFKGVSLKGNLQNGGSKMVYGSHQQENKDGLDSVLGWFDWTEEELDSYVKTLQEDSSLVIENADSQFAPHGLL